LATEDLGRLAVRDARLDDLAALEAIKGAGSEMEHRDRLRDASRGEFRYLVLQAGEAVVGLACLVFRRPLTWSDAEDLQRLPQIVDLQVLEGLRGRGCGTFFVSAIEDLARQAGCAELFLSVEPQGNPRAHALYQRLGYRQIQPEPYRSVWQFVDSGGLAHQGEDWVVDMVKSLA